MPTAAKLVAAATFAIVGLLAGMAYTQILPEGMATTNLLLTATGVGLFCGWFVMGRLVGQGVLPAAGHGLRTSLMIVVWMLLIFSIRQMLIFSTRMRYDGPVDAITGVFKLGAEYATSAATLPVIAVLIVGGLIGGALSEMASQRWR
ncbi:tellurium resistance protein [Maritimibacter sp. 55A14]|uniref:TrgA family protein n=1 Tax=Maritimibacter sp. 55A14 TaxID=2174844 RepID=UPI000D6074AF|nr:TrgA family protein [Maritimibacter sp. 55A14]PWE34228.1 tellurium resistance protein [Maritimibacter sp. 55A14]